MPSVKKTSPTASNRQAGSSVLSRIAPLRESKIGRLKMSLYGLPKTGKTRLACTFPKPLLIIGTEDGTASVTGTKGVEFVQLESCSDFSELVEAASSGRWKTVVLDNASGLRDIRIKEILGLSERPLQKGWGFAGRDAWTECANSMKGLLNPLLHLPNRMELNLVIIAHEQTYTDEEGNSNSDLIKPAVGSALGKSLCLWLNGECDYICQTFIREEVQTKETVVNKIKTSTKVRTGKKQFCLRVGPDATYITGFRLPIGRPEPPDVIIDPTYEKIAKLITG